MRRAFAVGAAALVWTGGVIACDSPPRDPDPIFYLDVFPVGDLVLARGQEVVLEVSASFYGTPAGEIEVTAAGLPPGVTASPLTLSGEYSGVLGLAVDDNASIGDIASVTIEGANRDWSEEITFELRVVAQLEPGMVDFSFGTAGVAALPRISVGGDLIVQPDGKFLMVGHNRVGERDLFVARMNEDGSLDTEFGEEGIASGGRPSGYNGEITPLHLLRTQNGDLIVLAFVSDLSRSASLLYRFTSTGVPTAPLILDERWSAAALDAEDRLLFIGGGEVARFSVDGILDTSFGEQGRAAMGVAVSADVVLDGEDVLVAGSAGTGEGPYVVRVTPTTTEPPLVVDIADGTEVCCIDIDAVGRVVVSGGSFSAARFDALLVADMTFGNPWASVDAGGEARDALLLPGGDLLIAGERGDLEPAILARFGSDGILVPFNLLIAAPIPVMQDVATMRLLPDGDLLVSGTSYDRAVVARIVL